MTSKALFQLLFVTLVFFALTACGGGGDSQSSTATPAPTTPTSNSSPSGNVTITGDNMLSSTLSIEQSLVDANGLGVFVYQWRRAGVAIANASSATYEITEDDLGNSLTVVISYTDGDGYSESVTSDVFAIPEPATTAQTPNILFIVSDDQGLDASNQYSYSNDPPITPNLDNLANQGLVFENVWVTPRCSTSRAALLTGMHGVNSGVTFVPAVLDTELSTIAKYLKSLDLAVPYQTAAFGKWHLAGGRNADLLHPNKAGFDHFAGNLDNISDYYNWEITENGEQTISSIYHTTAITELAIEWIDVQTSPWFVWLAYQAPHSPLHLPPDNLHSRNQLSGEEADINNFPREYYLASIDAMDTEIGRLIDSLDSAVRNNTLIVFIGDNGTPRRVIDNSVYDRSHGKSTLYEGGIRVPMFMSGAGVTRQGKREKAAINATDFYATIGQIAGQTTAQIFDSSSFYNLLSDFTSETARQQNYSEIESDEVTGWTITNSQLKLIQYEDGTQALYDISNTLDEGADLSSEAQYANDIAQLLNLGLTLRGEQQNGQDAVDITNQLFVERSGNCASYAEHYQSNVMDVNNSLVFQGALAITVSNGKCIFETNAIPNHDFNDGERAFPNDVSAQNDRYEITTSPSFANETTALSLRTDNAILLNGVKVDLLAAGCFGIGNGKIGCGDINQPWRYDPMFLDNGFNIDSHHAHAQGDGTYHYHGTPNAFYTEENTGNESPVVGFAADGFPIFGPYFNDNGTIRKATPSYRLKAGSRPNGDGEPGGTYNGAFRDDYKYVEGMGDLDQCNGMTVNGIYGYYITDGFPYILACFKGTPDPSFDK